MKIVPILITVAVLAFASAASHASCNQNWRFGGSFDYIISGNTRDLLGNAWNIGVEYDFTDLIPEDEAMGGSYIPWPYITGSSTICRATLIIRRITLRSV